MMSVLRHNDGKTINTFQVNITVRESCQRTGTARMIDVDQWLTDLDRPYQFHRRFDSILRYKKVGVLILVLSLREKR